jgi:streptogramin lyase
MANMGISRRELFGAAAVALVTGQSVRVRKIPTQAANTSGIAYGNGSVWMCANAAPFGIFQIDTKSGTVKRHDIPLGGGGRHGAVFAEGKLWLAALRLRGVLRVDPQTWEPEYLIPCSVPRAHRIAWDNGMIWMVTGEQDGVGLIR